MTTLKEKMTKWGSRLFSAVILLSAIVGVWWFVSDQYFKKAEISSQIVNETNVLDVHESLQDLQILFQGQNIQENKLNLRIYRVEVTNIGATNITQNDFDQNDLWGIRVDNGRVIATRLISASSDYINSNLNPQVQNDNLIKFNKIIFDQKDSFDVEVLVLHDKTTPPILYRVGKIAGIRENESRILSLQHDEPFWTSFFHGTMFVNSARFAIYFIISIVIFVLSIAVLVKIQENKKKAIQNPQPPQQPN